MAPSLRCDRSGRARDLSIRASGSSTNHLPYRNERPYRRFVGWRRDARPLYSPGISARIRHWPLGRRGVCFAPVGGGWGGVGSIGCRSIVPGVRWCSAGKATDVGRGGGGGGWYVTHKIGMIENSGPLFVDKRCCQGRIYVWVVGEGEMRRAVTVAVTVRCDAARRGAGFNIRMHHANSQRTWQNRLVRLAH